jgi:pyridoxal phosphate enzyme (YggS family)
MARICESVAKAALKAGRSPKDVSVVAVTKTVALPRILEALECGISHVGESRVQEAKEKLPGLPPGITRHMVGHLQTNKVGSALGIFDVIHSLDRVSLAQEISRRALAQGMVARVLVQVNTAGDEERHGVLPGGVESLVRQISVMGGLSVEGLMTIAPYTSEERRLRKAFSVLRELRDEIKGKNMAGVTMEHLSMGMSGDYQLAIEEGATLVRVGTAIFGSRPRGGDG